jgi:CRISPR-associated protein Cmr2
MADQIYTIITFAPVQGFIEKSRKLRDLYGSSYILSFLSRIICDHATIEQATVISPALPNVTQGMPNQIVLEGNLTEEQIKNIRKAFEQGWQLLADTCREWIERNVAEQQYCWHRDWRLWKQYTWEFFWAQGNPGESITQVRQRINQAKVSRDWTGINWQGESSTLSGSDAIAHPRLGQFDPKTYNYQQERTNVRSFYQRLSECLGTSFIEPREELSIPQLIKRLITHRVIVKNIVKQLRERNLINTSEEEEELTEIAEELKPDSFKDVKRQDENNSTQFYWTGWFLGDGDSATKYFQSLSLEEEPRQLQEFSKEMRIWGKQLRDHQDYYLQNQGRMIYAGGDDFLGILYDDAQPLKLIDRQDNQAKISPYTCLQWFYNFKSQVWEKPTPKKITPSVGLVWAGNQIPQRDVLQHCREAEQSAKNTGRDRIAFRILFNSGTHIEWVCPWWLLDKDVEEKYQKLKPNSNFIESYRDKNGGNNWTHFYRDVATIESRHAFSKTQTEIALGLVEIYFGSEWREVISNEKNWWNKYDNNEMQTFTGILGDSKNVEPDSKESSETKTMQLINNWVINLAKVGFRLADDN